MLEFTLTRAISANLAIVGVFEGLSRSIYTLEHRWNGNNPKTSCIPAGRYLCVPHGWEPGNPNGFSKTQVWEITGVPNRSAVLIHIGNTLKDTLGCVLGGLGAQITQLQSSISDSTLAINLMRKEIGENSFWLTIK